MQATFLINFWYTWKSCGICSKKFVFCVRNASSQKLWIPCCPFRKGDWDSPGLPTAVSSMLHPLLKNSGLVQAADWITPLSQWTCFLARLPSAAADLDFLSSTWAFFFLTPRNTEVQTGTTWGERHAEFSNCSGSMFALQAWKELPLWTRSQSFHRVFFFHAWFPSHFLTIWRMVWTVEKRTFMLKCEPCACARKGSYSYSNRLMPNANYS